MTTRLSKWKNALFHLLCALAILSFGGLLGLWSLHQTAFHFQHDFLRDSQRLISGLNPARIHALARPPTDDSSHIQLRLHRQLQIYFQQDPRYERVCLVKSDGQRSLLCLLDVSSNTDSAPAKDPGDPFPNAPTLLAQTFETLIPSVTPRPLRGPDGWRLHAFIPVPATNPHDAVVAIVTAPASVWVRTLAHSLISPAVFTLGLLLLALAFALVRSRPRLARSPRYFRRLVLGLSALTGLWLAIIVGWFLSALEENHLRELFLAIAQRKADQTLNAVLLTRDQDFATVCRACESVDDMSAPSFAHCLATLNRQQSLHAWGWIPRRTDGTPDAPARYPLSLLQPASMMSLFDNAAREDLAAIPWLQPVMQEAETTGLPVASPLQPGVPLTDHLPYAILLQSTALPPAPSPSSFVLAILVPQHMLDNILNFHPDDRPLVNMRWELLSADAEPKLLAASGSVAHTAKSIAIHRMAWTFRQPFTAFGRTFQVTIRPTSLFFITHYHRTAFLFLGFGLTITLLALLVFRRYFHHRQELEATLLRSNRSLATEIDRYSKLALHSRSITWETSINGLFTRMSESCAAITGFFPEEVIGKFHCYDFPDLEEENGTAFTKIFRDAILHRTPLRHLQHPLRTRSGPVLWIATDMVPVYSSSGTLSGFQGTSTDITSRHLSETSLQQSRQNYINVLNNLPGMAFRYPISNLWAPPEYVSAGSLELTGFSPAELTAPGQDRFRSLIDPMFLRRLSAINQRLIAGATRQDCEFKITDRSGNIKWVRQLVHTVRAPDGNIIAVEGFLSDITAQKTAAQYRAAIDLTRRILASSAELSVLLRRLATAQRRLFGIKAVAIRLRDGAEFPYAAIDGFPPDFLCRTKSLRQFNPDGSTLTDASTGCPVLRCMCGHILNKKRLGPDDCYTPFGSFVSNRAPDDLVQITCSDGSRPGCIRAGYQSMLISPIRIGSEVIGLLQLCDPLPARFPPDIVHLIESIATQLADTIASRRTGQDYRHLFQTMKQGFVLLEAVLSPNGDPIDYTLIALNNACADIWPSAPSLPSAASLKQYAPDLFPIVDARFHEMRAAGHDLHFTHHFIPQDRHAECTFYSVTSNRFAILLHDITPRLLAEARIREFKRVQDLLLSHLPGLAFRCKINDNWTMEFASDGCFDLTGWKADELLGDRQISHRDLIAPAARAAVKTAVTKAVHDHTPLNLEYEIIRKDGAHRWVWEQSSPVYDDHGQPLAIEGFISDITPTRNAQRDLHESRQRFESLLSNLDGMVYRCSAISSNSTSSVEFVSAGAFPLSGFSPNELLGDLSCIRSLIHPDFRDEHARLWKIAIAKQTRFSYEYPIIRKDGTIRWVLETGRGILDPSGGIHHIEGYVLDISARIKAETELRELMRFTPGGIFRYSAGPDEQFNFINQNMLDMLGYTEDEFKTKFKNRFSLMVWHEDRARVLKEIDDQIAENGSSDFCTYRIETKSGRLIWVYDVGHFVRDELGNPWFYVTINDITQNIRDQERIRESERKYRTLTDNMKDVVWVFDADDLRYTYVSPSILSLRGYTPEEFIALPFTDLMRLREKAIRDAIRLGRDALASSPSADSSFHTAELPALHKNGHIIQIEAIYHFLHNPANGHLEMHGVSRDITERKLAEQERESLRTQLLQSNKMESLGRLAGGIAHDFNNMLQAITGYSEMALEQIPPSSSLHADILSIQTIANRSADFIRQLLLFSRKQSSAPRIIDLNDSIRNMISFLSHLLGDAIQVTLSCDKAACPVKIDPSQLDQILANLCINARDAMHNKGHLTIRSSLQILPSPLPAVNASLPPGRYAVLSVTDTGCGMDSETVAHIFEPFFTTKAVGKGTGLGLSTVYGIVQSVGGGLTLHSELGCGSVFHLYFPSPELLPDSPNDKSATPTTATHLPRGNETILLLDDESTIRHSTARMLSSLGYTPLPANSTDEALEILKFHSGVIHLILCDVLMPDMNGPDFMQAARAIRPDIPHLFMSGYTANLLDDRIDTSLIGDILSKPFSRPILAQRIREILDA